MRERAVAYTNRGNQSDIGLFVQAHVIGFRGYGSSRLRRVPAPLPRVIATCLQTWTVSIIFKEDIVGP